MRIPGAHRIFLTSILSLLCLILTIPELTVASLTPEEILVVVNANSRDSIQIGRLYIKLRKIPSTHLIEVKVPISDEISRTKYEELLATPLRKALKKLHDRGKKIRCIVTTYGIPLRIGEQIPPGISQEDIKKHKEMLKQKKENCSNLTVQPNACGF